MYRDMTRGSITRGLLLFALPMAAEDPCGAGLCAGGAGGRQRHLGRYPYRLVSGGRRGIRLLLPPAQSAAPAPAPSVEKDLSGFGDAAEAFDLGDID